MIINTATASDDSKLLLAYIYNFGKFAEWNEDILIADQPLEFCFYGEQADLNISSQVLEKKYIQNHTIDVKNINRGGPLQDCHIVYIYESESLYLPLILDKLNGIPVLTISKIDGFSDSGGVIGLIYHKNKLRFEINTITASDNNIKISSELLRLAVKVIE